MLNHPTASPLKILKEKKPRPPKRSEEKKDVKVTSPKDEEHASTRKLLAVPAARLPHFILSQIFEYLTLSDVANCMRVCKQWNFVLSNEDCAVWRNLCRKHLSAEGQDFYLLAMSDVVTSKNKLRAFAHAWNPKDISKNNFVQTNGFTVHRQPIAQSTDGVRGKIGVKEGIHAFDITWDGPLGTVAVVGFATKHAALHCPGYIPLLGSDDQSWGWNLVDNCLLHNNKTLGIYPRINNPPKYLMGERIRLIIDCDSHKAYFERGDDWMGIAFTDLPPVRFYPSVCAVYGNTEVSMIYVGPAVLG